jgi:flavodoxin
MPMAVYTFLESYDFSGKTIIPFCTHEGSGLGNSAKDITKLCPKAKVVKMQLLLWRNRKKCKGEVERWIQKRQK